MNDRLVLHCKSTPAPQYDSALAPRKHYVALSKLIFQSTGTRTAQVGREARQSVWSQFCQGSARPGTPHLLDAALHLVWRPAQLEDSPGICRPLIPTQVFGGKSAFVLLFYLIEYR
jgi:hypothetical protein